MATKDPTLSKTLAKTPLDLLDRARRELRGKIIVGGMSKRTKLLEQALIIEGMISILLGPLLGFAEKTPVINSARVSFPFQFRVKVWLLRELRVIDDKQKERLQLFGDIRNEFIHNWDASTYTKNLKGIDRTTYLLRMYPQDESKPMERRLERAVGQLTRDVRKTTITVVDRFIDRAWDKVVKDHAMEEINFRAAKNAMVRGFKELKADLAKKFESDHPFTKQEVFDIPDVLLGKIDALWHEEWGILMGQKKEKREKRVKVQTDASSSPDKGSKDIKSS